LETDEEQEALKSLDRTNAHRRKFRASLDKAANVDRGQAEGAEAHARTLQQWRQEVVEKSARLRVNFRPSSTRYAERMATRSVTKKSGDVPADLFSHRVHVSSAAGATVVSSTKGKGTGKKSYSCGICKEALRHRCPDGTSPQRLRKGESCPSCQGMVYDHTPCRSAKRQRSAEKVKQNGRSHSTSLHAWPPSY
jgi:hypothetical protein